MREGSRLRVGGVGFEIMTWGLGYGVCDLKGLAKGSRKPQCGGSAQFGDARHPKESIHWHLKGCPLRGLEVAVWG